jgi:hypothetical protein
MEEKQLTLKEEKGEKKILSCAYRSSRSKVIV